MVQGGVAVPGAEDEVKVEDVDMDGVVAAEMFVTEHPPGTAPRIHRITATMMSRRLTQRTS